jgi:rhamnopyranosyl-N-acetylglucosaminyl-diphospho-decaprenol beta-1,3/1,4-galactofuranosyltransferase
VPEQSDPIIVAVVVTFNRRPLLARLLDVLQQTPRLAEIIVVDNASTDGTADWVRGLDALAGARGSTAEKPSVAEERGTSVSRPPVPVHLVALDTNTGGAGGFHSGIETAIARGADLVWLMDDDGVPAPDCLDRLLEHSVARTADFWGPAVLAEQDPTRLCFPIRLPGRASVVHDMKSVEAAAVDGVIEGIVIPFNGVLITRELVERIGLPREEFFIWGDDVEYRLRAERAGLRIATVVDAHFLHPATDHLGTPMMFGRTTYNHSPSDLKHYCMARNNVVNLRDYRGWLAVLAFLVKTVWFYLFTRRDLHRITLSAGAARAGLRGDFTGHRRYLGG